MPLTLHIDALVHGGYGIARTPEGAVFVTDVAAGETVRVEVTGTRARCRFARPLEILERSPARREPFCPLSGTCGGCNWQHILPESQLTAKRDILTDCLRRQAKLTSVPAIETVGGEETRYRMRAQFAVDQHTRAAGFFRRDTNDVVRVESCPLLVAELDTLLAWVNANPERIPRTATHVRAIAGDSGRIAVSPMLGGAGCHEHTTVTIAGRTFRLRGESFFQNNRHLTPRLAGWVKERARGRTCVDLYGGAGFFASVVADAFERVTLVEIDRTLTELAQVTFENNELTHCEAVRSSAEAYLGTRAKDRPDVLIVDPPRQGLTGTVTAAIGTLAAKSVVYISCDPATLARDLGLLVRTHGYSLRELAVFDLYPNTHHIETAVLLQR